MQIFLETPEEVPCHVDLHAMTCPCFHKPSLRCAVGRSDSQGDHRREAWLHAARRQGIYQERRKGSFRPPARACLKGSWQGEKRFRTR